MCLGYYCPTGTKYSTEHPCPAGTFSNLTGVANLTECQACPAGYYCDIDAQTDYSKLCTAG